MGEDEGRGKAGRGTGFDCGKQGIDCNGKGYGRADSLRLTFDLDVRHSAGGGERKPAKHGGEDY